MVEAEQWARQARRAMVETIADEVVQTGKWLGKTALDPRVMSAMAEVPRHEFVDAAQRVFAYANRPLPIGQGQTISQPYIVAIMSDLAAPGPDSRVLEVGTGCGYQTAVLAALGARVTSVELVPELAEQAAARLEHLGYGRAEVHQGNGAAGWPPNAPYDAILVTAAAFDRVPPALLEQLARGGRMIIPVERHGRRGSLFGGGPDQELMLITKDADGRVSERAILPVAFVPLVEKGDAAAPD